MKKKLQENYYKCLLISQTKMMKEDKMNYNIVDIIDNNLTDSKLKVLINKKLYKIIELMEFNVNYSE